MRGTLLALAMLAACGPARAAADVELIGPEFAMSGPLLSDDGQALTGFFHSTAFQWMRGRGSTDLLTFPSAYPNNRFELPAISGDGSVVLLNLPSALSGRPQQNWVPALWTRDTGARVVDIPGLFVVALDMSADGRTIAGYRLGPSFSNEVFRWSSDDGLQIMSVPEGLRGYSFDPSAISGDGRTVIGRASGSGLNSRVFVWQAGRDPFFIDASLGYAASAAVDVSRDGNRITGVSYSPVHYSYQAYLWDATTGVTLLGVLPSTTESIPAEISANGQVVVGNAYASGGKSQAFRWTAQTGMLSVQQWIQAYGVNLPEGVVLSNASSTNGDGSVVTGTTSRGRIWLARVNGPSGGFLLDLPEYQRSLIDANQRLSLGLGSLAGATLSGRHHRSLLDNGLIAESDRSCAWVQAEAADYGESQTRTEQVEVGACTDLGPVRLGLGLGKARARQDWNLGSRSTTEGEYLLGEAAFKMGAHWQGSVLGYSGRFDVDSQRRYYNGTAIHTSSARPDAKVSALRARLDWKDAVQVAGFGVSPYAAYTWTKTRLDGYTEHGGGFPSRFDPTDWSTRDLRLGAAFARGIGARNDLSVSLEAVRRLDKIASGTRGEIIDLFGFDLPGRALDRDWGQVLVDFDHRFANGSVLGLGARGASSGGEADWGVSAGYRLAF